MALTPRVGPCHLCGTTGPLSFEHVPPKQAFNWRPVQTSGGEELLQAVNLDDLRGRIAQRGSGNYTLCGRCNNLTGHWYGAAYIDFAWQAARVLHLSRGAPSLYYNYLVFPLRVIKQIICMFFSVNGPELRKANPELATFVRSREAIGLDPRYRVFAFFTNSPRSRQVGLAGILSISTATTRLLSELTSWPLGYVLAFGSDPPDASLVDITFMAKYRYLDWCSLAFQLPVKDIYTPLPGDYRPEAEVKRAVEQNVRLGLWPPPAPKAPG